MILNFLCYTKVIVLKINGYHNGGAINFNLMDNEIKLIIQCSFFLLFKREGLWHNFLLTIQCS